MVIPDDVRAALVAHAEGEAPNEACGLVLLRDGRAERYEPGRNAASSPYRFELEFDDPEIWFAEDAGYELAVFHSHISAPARPSRTDVENIGSGQGSPYLVYSIQKDDLAAFGSKTARSKRFRSARNFEEAEHLRLVNRAVELQLPFFSVTVTVFFPGTRCR